ncbi:uncharacterized protein LOC127712679 [Mytilus californianus]|uniref:uncharacterized protein LOC127712679 n=1 Tax=Mytilus californianus TaxID=6549 RepID=UPI002245812E|nr:uncharacterized protein LOC127712679 [Mytilus californianus]
MMKNCVGFLLFVFVFTANNKKIVNACTIDEFECIDGKCINLTKTCDNEFDCDLPDHSDEINCTYIQPCPEGNHKCETGECVNNQTECPIVTSILSLSSSIAIDIQSSFVLPTTSSKLISATSHSNSYTLMKSSQYNLLETWSDASLSSTVIQLSSISTLPERLSTAVFSSDTQNTFHLQSSSAFMSSSDSIKPITTHLPYQTSVIDTTPTYPVTTPPTEDHKPDEGSNTLLYLLFLLVLLIPLTIFVARRYRRKMRSFVYVVTGKTNKKYDAARNSEMEQIR